MNPPTSDLRPLTSEDVTVDPFPMVAPAPIEAPAPIIPPGAPAFPAESYAAAINAERENRDYAFLGLEREICGLPVRQMSLRQFLIRASIGCPFLCGEIPEAGDVASFLWFLNPDFSSDLRSPTSDLRADFIRRLAAIPYDELVAGIEAYISDTFMDAPPSGGGAKRAPTASIAASYIDIFASEYGWTIDAILDAPLVQLYQLLRERAQRRNPKAIVFNRISDRVMRDFAAALNEFNEAEAAIRATSFEPTKPDSTEGQAQ